MTRLSDEELREQIDRRLAAPLDDATRDTLLATIGTQVRSTRRTQHAFGWPVVRLASVVAAFGLLLLTAALVLPPLARAPGPAADPARTPPPSEAPTPTPARTPVASAPPITVLTVQQLAMIAGDEAAIGSVVVAHMPAVTPRIVGDPCATPEECGFSRLADYPDIYVTGVRRDTEEARFGAFRVSGRNIVELLGDVTLLSEPGSWTVDGILGYRGDRPLGLVPVDGWLVGAATHSCPAPLEPLEHAYGCGSEAWITNDYYQPTTIHVGSDVTTVEGRPPDRALRVQNGAYLEFAPEAVLGDVGMAEPRRAVYLIREAACPFERDGCPVWEIVGRPDADVLTRLGYLPRGAITRAPSPEPTNDPFTDARAVLDRWAQAVRSAPDGAITFTGFVSYGGGWRGPDADEQKSAFQSGHIEASVPLPTDVPPPGLVVWADGSSATVPLASAAEAFEELRRGLANDACPDCRPLEVIGARLITRGANTSRGWADVPAWEFIFAQRDAPIDPVSHVAVRDRVSVPMPEDVSGLMTYALGTPSSTSLTVAFSGSACGPEHYTAQAVESEVGVAVLVQPDPPPAPDATPEICIAMAVGRTTVVELAAPLGGRTVLDPVSGQPIPVYAELPEGGFPRP